MAVSAESGGSVKRVMSKAPLGSPVGPLDAKPLEAGYKILLFLPF